MFLSVGIHGAAAGGDGAPLVLELDGGVVNLEVAREDVVHMAENAVALRWRHVLDHGMAAQRVRAGTKAPDMEIVNIDYARDAAQQFGYSAGRNSTGDAFQQRIERFMNDVRGAPDDECSDDDRENRIDHVPARCVDDERTDDDGD